MLGHTICLGHTGYHYNNADPNSGGGQSLLGNWTALAVLGLNIS